MHPNQTLLNEFYTAFARRDAATMVSAYADSARFSDPVFPDLDADRVRAMWTMLLARGKDLEVTFRDIQADDVRGRAHWEATYTFGSTGRRVHNVIDAAFEFQDGKIVRHVDSFDLWRWSRMALGLKGALLGWTPLVRNKVRATAARQLAKAM